MLKPSSRVLRDGQLRSEAAESLVVGDVVHVTMGDCVPADLRVVESSGCQLDCSTLTGESEPVAVTTVATDSDPHRSATWCGVAEGVAQRSPRVNHQKTTICEQKITILVF